MRTVQRRSVRAADTTGPRICRTQLGILLLMAPTVERHLPEIQRLCRRYRVRRLDLFGSATTDAFDPDRSDLDFLIAFDRREDAAAGYLELLTSLEDLFERRVDLVDIRAARNPYLIASALKHRENLYAA